MIVVRRLLAKLAKYFLLCCFLFVALLAALVWYVRTESFQHMVRGRITREIERATGGRAELGRFHVSPFRFRVDVEDFTVRGREPAGQAPLLHVDRLSAIVNLSSALGAKIGFHSLTLGHPVVHVMFYPDGTSNRPTPQPHTASNFEQLFAVSIDKLVVERGELLWQDERLPLDFTLNDLSAGLDYSFLHRVYSGRLSVGNAELKVTDFRPFAFEGQTVFTLKRNEIDFSLLRVSSEGSRLQASGSVGNLAKPVVKADYDLVLNLAQAAAIARRPEIRSGKLELRGSGLWSHDELRGSGRFAVAGLFWRDNSIRVNNASAGGRFLLDPGRLTFSQVEGQLFQGSFSSDGEISGWPSSVGREKNPATSGVVRVKAKDISVAELRAGLGPQAGPFQSLKFEGDLSGDSEIRWKNTLRNAQLKVIASVTRPGHLSPGGIPLTAAINAGYDARARELNVQDFSASTPASEVHARGNLSPAGVLRFSFSTSNLDEWRPLTAAVFPSGLPLAVNQRTTVNGSISGGLRNPSIAANFDIRDVDISIPQSAAVAGGTTHWDSLNGDLQISSRSLLVTNATARSGAATVKFLGTVGLAAWKTFPASAIQLHGQIENADSSQLAHMLRRDLALSGRLNSVFRVTGPLSNLEGLGTIRLSGASIQGYAVDSATALVLLKSTQMEFKQFDAVSGASRLSGGGSYDLEARSFELNLAGHNFDIAAIPQLQNSRISFGGRVDFSSQLSGTENEPQVAAQVHLRSLTLNQELAGDYWLDLATKGTNLHLSGHSDFKNAELLISGDVHLLQQWPARIDFHFNSLDVDSFLASYLRSHVTGHSRVAGDLRLEGPLRNPRELTWTGNLTDFDAEIEKVKLKNEGPIRFSFAGEALKVEALHVTGENADFSGTGWVQLSRARAMDFAVHGKLGVTLVQNYDPDFSGSGTVTGDARIRGTLDSPLIEGRLQVEGASIADINLPSALNDMNGALRFSQNQITIESLTARSGGGTLSLTGHAEFVRRQLNFDLNVDANGVRLRYPPGVSSTADAALHWSGSNSGSLLSGDITITKLGVTPGFDFGAYLERSIQQSSLPQTDPVLNRIRLDLHVVTAPELEMQTSVLRMRGEADLRVRGSAAKPVLLGRGDIFEGQAYFNGTKYRLERGGVTFTNPAITTPFLDVEAVTHVRDYDITLSLNGDVSKPNGLKVNYRSEPPLPSADIITLLAFGQTTETSAQLQQSSQSAFSQQASNAMLAAALNATLNNRAQRLFGNSRIKIDPQGLETETSPTQSGPAVTIEQQVKDNLTLSYTTNVSQTSQQVIRAEYNVSRNLSIVAIRDQNGVVSFDVKIRRRKR